MEMPVCPELVAGAVGFVGVQTLAQLVRCTYLLTLSEYFGVVEPSELDEIRF